MYLKICLNDETYRNENLIIPNGDNKVKNILVLMFI